MAQGIVDVSLWRCWLFADFDNKNQWPTCCKDYTLYQFLKLNSYYLHNKTLRCHLFGDLKPEKKYESFFIIMPWIKSISFKLFIRSWRSSPLWLFSVHSFHFLFFRRYICDLSLGSEDCDWELSGPPDSWITLS